jgi:cytochrome c-type biogenesis protein CcmE
VSGFGIDLAFFLTYTRFLGRNSMTHMRAKLIGGGAAVLIAVSLLAMVGVRDGWVYYLSVDQFVSDPDHQGQRVRLHGTVAEEHLQIQSAQLVANFELCGEEETIQVCYSGVIPDLFDAGREVVVEGKLDANGVIQANVLMTKCASKYETEEGQAPHSSPIDDGETPA